MKILGYCGICLIVSQETPSYSLRITLNSLDFQSEPSIKRGYNYEEACRKYNPSCSVNKLIRKYYSNRDIVIWIYLK